MLPLVLGIAVGAGFSDCFVKKFGTNRVVSVGMLALALGLTAFLLWNPETEYWVVALNLFIMAFAAGNIMAPSTDAVMGAVPEAKAGMASAVNGVSRMVAGALGAAIVGSAMYTIFADKLSGAVSMLPAEAADVAQDSVGAAMVIAESLPPEIGEPLARAAAVAFTESFGIAVLISNAVALLGAVLVAVYMPPTHLELEEDDEMLTSDVVTGGRHVAFPVQLQPGVNNIAVSAQSAGVTPPLVAEITISNVTAGSAVQLTRGLNAGEQQTFTITAP
jgi:MFS family permease